MVHRPLRPRVGGRNPGRAGAGDGQVRGGVGSAKEGSGEGHGQCGADPGRGSGGVRGGRGGGRPERDRSGAGKGRGSGGSEATLAKRHLGLRLAPLTSDAAARTQSERDLI